MAVSYVVKQCEAVSEDIMFAIVWNLTEKLKISGPSSGNTRH